ncbi:MAG: carboxylesterase/lipase family protein, partial [Acidimicrobiales bacterium]
MTGPTVETKYGRLRGRREGPVVAFRGIPFGRAPAGPLRFRPPQPPEPWAGARPAVDYGAAAPQLLGQVPMLPGDPTETDEDCLTLNVWTPGLDGARRPVLVWIHGGAFIGGSGANVLYRGDRLAARGDVVVVTCNYRLGALGFLAHPDLRDPETGAAGNWGLLDQVAALDWVRDHVESLGGDPGNVTAFGESAGAMSVGTLLAVPAAAGLFHRAILQSGAPVVVGLDQAAATAEVLLRELGVDGGTGRLAALGGLPAEAVVKAQSALLKRGIGQGLPFTPVVDGAVVPRPPLAAVAGGCAPSVPLLAGTNRDEATFFAASDPRFLTLDEAGLREWLAVTMDPDRAEAAVAAYRAARAERGQPVRPIDLWTAIETDRAFRAPAMRLLDAQRPNQGAVYAYLFAWETPVLGGALGAC